MRGPTIGSPSRIKQLAHPPLLPLCCLLPWPLRWAAAELPGLHRARDPTVLGPRSAPRARQGRSSQVTEPPAPSRAHPPGRSRGCAIQESGPVGGDLPSPSPRGWEQTNPIIPSRLWREWACRAREAAAETGPPPRWTTSDVASSGRACQLVEDWRNPDPATGGAMVLGQASWSAGPKEGRIRKGGRWPRGASLRRERLPSWPDRTLAERNVGAPAG